MQFQSQASLHVDQTDYHATCSHDRGDACHYSFTLVATYANGTPDTVRLPRCTHRDRSPMYGVEPFPDTSEEAAYDRVWACVGGVAPIVVPPHTDRVDTLQIDGPNAFDGKTHQPVGKVEGQFRLIYNFGRCREGAARCAARGVNQRSQPFRVHVAP